MRQAILDILLHSEIRKEGQILKNVSYATPGHGNVDGGVRSRYLLSEQNSLPHTHSARIRRGQSGDAVEHCGFSRARGAEEDGEAGSGPEVYLKRELAVGGGETFADVDAQERFH